MTLQTKPERFVVGNAAHRRCTDGLCSLKTGCSIATVIEIKILRARLAPDGQSPGTSSSNGVQGMRTTDMHNIERSFWQRCQRYIPPWSLAFQNSRAR